MQWCIGLFRLDLDHACLWRGDERVGLRPKTFDLLVYLVEHAGDLVTKEELLTALWPEMVVADSALTVCVSELRKALGETARAPEYIATVHRRGYRFIAPVTPLASPAPLALSAVFEPPPVEAPALSPPLAAERRQLSILFCDLVDSTRLAGQLDLEDWREVLHAYHQTCAEVVARFEGYVAQYLGDGVLVYFGYPVAHEDDAQRAVWSGLGLLEALAALNARLTLPAGYTLAVRLGLHTGLVVVGQVGAGERQEPLAQGETPHLAVRLQSLAGANELVVSAATRELLGGVFRVKELGEQVLQGGATPMQMYRVEGAEAVESRFEAMRVSGLTPLVGRDEELELLWRRWQQATEGEGQVVLLSGEAGIGKSRLIQALVERLGDEPHQRVLYQGSPYHTHSAFYPIIVHLERILQLDQVSLPAAKLDRLETLLAQAGLPVAELTPLFAALLSIPSGDRYAPLRLSPERQKERTIEALVAQLLSLSKREPLLLVFEDAHWSDPSTLEVFDRFIDGLQAASVLVTITYRPAFESHWRSYGHVTTQTLNRLTRRQVMVLVAEVTGYKTLPQEVLDQIVAKTDGVPLFVEELTKTVLESVLLEEQDDHYTLNGPLPSLAIPATLQDSLMARLDRLESAKAVAQYAAVMGRQVSYALLQAVSSLDEATLQHELGRLVEAELLYQRGLPPQATYTFKHALIQDSAYQSLVRSTKQAYHHRIAEVLEARFPETVEAQPGLLAFHYTEAGLMAQAVGYWQRAGEKAIDRSATAEAIAHFHTGLELLQRLPESPKRTQQELTLHLRLAVPLVAFKGQAAPEVECVYTRARDLCQEVGDASQLIPVLWGLFRCYGARAEFQKALDLANHMMHLAHTASDTALLVEVHRGQGGMLFCLGSLTSARTHLEQGIALYESQQHHVPTFLYEHDAGVACHNVLVLTLWLLGYPDQAFTMSQRRRTLAQELMHPHTLAFALGTAAMFYQFRREPRSTREQAEAVIALSTEQEFLFYGAIGTILRGWQRGIQGETEVGITQMHQGLAAYRGTEAVFFCPYFLCLLAEVYGQSGQPASGLERLAEALELVAHTGERFYEAELHRVRGELLLSHCMDHQTEAESCFYQALSIAQEQSAKSWELRAATSLARLWHTQGKRDEARRLLRDVYDWFTEGLDTADLIDAKALLDDLSP
jgi:predicted ATPase/class 3 adenylate cyclase